MIPMPPQPRPPSGRPQHRPIESPCPGCGEQKPRPHIACEPCYLAVPGEFKARFAATEPRTDERRAVVREMQAWLRGRWLDTGGNP